ncbi:hypothetical protein G7048_14615 [Diaphorobacter sp. HDW4B]|uniref:hypothetical protein n=1 Tax=Diaphorobacter sp. HDW4B TaxID=2714925 RepID=UPI001409BDD2|nr:hypothetical protein [Diaphorobacter sp. HDW4B]QIL71478.1 hypothetical protein G7048_14615 [Diaphorobacter sp. HDW4B]
MKRKHIFRALAVAAACVLSLNAQAVTKLEGATANTLQVSESGAGHFLIVPYFTTQSGNALLLSLINMDEVNGKAVKLRFRSARNADTLFDFQVFLAPGDMWTGNVSQNGNGLSYLTTSDASCSKPGRASINATPFKTGRLNPKASAAARADETREGYIEIVTMADIPPSSSGLFPLITLENEIPGCEFATSSALWSALDVNKTGLADYAAMGMQPPSTGLTANWTIMNVPKALSWSGAAFALEARRDGRAARGNLAYFPQSTSILSNVGTYTADPLFAASSLRLVGRMNDLPDISTPYVAGVSNPSQQAKALTSLLEVPTVSNEFWTDAGIAAETEWLFSMPTRRFIVGIDYSAEGMLDPVVNSALGATEDSSWISMPSDWTACLDEPSRTVRDRSGVRPDSVETQEIRINFLCGATTLYPVRSHPDTDGGVLSSSSAPGNVRTVDVTNGWMSLRHGGWTGNGMPVIGQAFVRAFNPNVAPGTAGNFSVTWPHRLLKN